MVFLTFDQTYSTRRNEEYRRSSTGGGGHDVKIKSLTMLLVVDKLFSNCPSKSLASSLKGFLYL